MKRGESGLTANVHDPLSSLQEADVVRGEKKVDELIDQKDVPFCKRVRWMPQRHQGEDQGREGCNESGHTRDPSEGVDHTAPITLSMDCQ